ncbi:MAG: hypothetical protein ACT6Q8_24895 [Niveispirillum sp.]|uniref:hypothetical protein n=1 Tax=Niveispirillum sp. TaxID=1917217 RepID=UPI004036206B
MPLTVMYPRTIAGAPLTVLDQTPGGTASNYGPILSGMPGPFQVGAGSYPITSNVTITQPLQFCIGARLVIASGVTLTINAHIDADWYQQIFDTSASNASVVGTFGNSSISPGWWGAVPNGHPNGSGTNNLKAFQECLRARHRSDSVAARVFVPAGRWLIEGPAAAAVPGLAAAGLLQLYPGDCMTGEGWDSCAIIVGNTSSGNVISVGAPNTQGPPSEVGGFMLVAEVGGAFSCNGLMVYANGAQVRDVWISGFSTGLRLDSTDQFARNFVVEHCSEGLRVQRGGTTVSDGEVFLCGNAIIIEHQDNQGITVMDNVRVVGRDQAQSGGLGIVVTGTTTKAQIINCAVEGQFLTLGYWLVNTPWTQLTNCSAKMYGNADGLRIEAASGVLVENFQAEVYDGTPSSNKGIAVINNSGTVSITGGRVRNFWYGAYNETAGDTVCYTGLIANGNRFRGMHTERCTTLNVVGGSYSYNSGAGSNDCGIFGLISAAADVHLYTGVLAVNGGAATQDYGIRYQINVVGARVRISGATAAMNNTTAQVTAAGGTYTAAPQFVVGAEVVTA